MACGVLKQLAGRDHFGRKHASLRAHRVLHEKHSSPTLIGVSNAKLANPVSPERRWRTGVSTGVSGLALKRPPLRFSLGPGLQSPANDSVSTTHHIPLGKACARMQDLTPITVRFRLRLWPRSAAKNWAPRARMQDLTPDFRSREMALLGELVQAVLTPDDSLRTWAGHSSTHRLQRYWPCKSNSVRLSSSPRALRASAAFGLWPGFCPQGQWNYSTPLSS